jgi:peroxiredoxin
MTLNIGDKAPGFVLKDTDLKDLSLTDFSGQNLVIVFFPLAFTSVCTTELCFLRDNLERYSKLDSSVVAISVDSPFTLKKFREENNLNFPVLSDFNKVVCQSYGAYYEDFVLGLKGVAKRAVFVVDKNGTIQYTEILENASNLPNFENLNLAVSDIN